MMLFRNRKTENAPDRPDTMSGLGAARAVEAAAADALVVVAAPDSGDVDVSLRHIAETQRQKLIVREAASATELSGLVVGYAASGLRSAALADASFTHNALRAGVDAHIPFVLHLTELTADRDSGENTGHAGYYHAANSGAFALFASGVQEVADLALIAHRIAEMALIPGVCAQDTYRTGKSLRRIRLPDAVLVESFLGQAGDLIASPTPSQRMLFGDRRLRVPRLVDVDHPAGIGCRYDNDSHFRSAIARQTFFADHVAGIADATMLEFSALTGRNYRRLREYRVDDAEIVVVVQGAITQELCAVVDHFRATRKIRAGVVEITMFHPFPGADLSHALAGKAAVTVLDRIVGPHSDDTPLAAAVRNSIDRSTENASAPADDKPHPTYATMSLRERPQIFTGAYGARWELPTFGELAAVVMNAKSGRQRRFYAGVDFTRDYRRHPHLHTLQQRIAREYPDHASMSLPALDVKKEESRSVVWIHARSSHGVLAAGNLFARFLAVGLERHVSTFPSGGLEPTLEPASIAIVHANEAVDERTAPTIARIGVFASTDMLERFTSVGAITPGGVAIVGCGESPQTLWRRLSPRTAHWLKSQKIRLCTVDADAIAAGSTARPTFIDQLAIWALLGACVTVAEDIADAQRDHLARQLQAYVEGATGLAWVAGDIAHAFVAGKDAMQEIDWRAVDADDSAPVTEPTAPWTVDGTDHDGGAFDATRFWNSVGYLYETGQSRSALVDPFAGSSVIPARSGAFRDVTPYRLRMPRWLPENCTACGLCWATCPDSALPTTVQSVASLLEGAIERVEAEGKPTTQIKRLREHLAKSAYRIAASDDLKTHTTLGALLGHALDQLMARMELAEDQRAAITNEFVNIRALVESYPVARTAVFFDAPHKERKGDGQLLSIAVNAKSCKACGLCVAVCPDNAFELTAQDADYLDRLHHCSDFQRTLPEVMQSTIAAAEKNAALGPVYRLLDNRVYHAMVGGDGAFPGTGAKTAVHLTIAAIESASAAHFAAHIERLNVLIEKIKDKIQGTVSSAVAINDFDAFARRLSDSVRENLSGQDLAGIARDSGKDSEADAERLRLLSDLLAKLEGQRQMFRNRARVVIALGTAEVTRWSGTYPYNPHANPWLAHHSGAGLAVANALYESIGARLASEMATCRQAAREIAGEISAAETEHLDWRDLDTEERAVMPTVLVILREQDVDANTLRNALNADYPLKILVLVDSAAATTGQITPIVAPGAFSLQSSVSHPDHLMSGVIESVAHAGPALLRVLAPDPVADDIAPESIVEQARLAVTSRAFPLLRGRDGTLTTTENPDPADTWSQRKLTFREPSGSIEEMQVPVTPADWAIGVGLYHHEFSIVAKGHAAGHTKLLSDYVGLDATQRADFTPYVHIVGSGRQHMIAVPSVRMVSLTQRIRDAWCALSAGGSTAPTTPASSATPTPPIPPTPGAYQQLVDRLLWLSGFGRDPEFFAQSLGEFVLSQRNDGQDTDGDPTSTH